MAAASAEDKGSRGPHLPITRIALGLVVVIALAIGARLLLVDDPTGGRPSATTQIAAGLGQCRRRQRQQRHGAPSPPIRT